MIDDNSHKLLSSLFKSTHIKKRIIILTPLRYTLPMLASIAQTAFELLGYIRSAIEEQPFGVTSESDELPVRPYGKRACRPFLLCKCSVVNLLGPRAPAIEPDLKISIGRKKILFLLGEVVVSDIVEYTKLKSEI